MKTMLFSRRIVSIHIEGDLKREKEKGKEGTAEKERVGGRAMRSQEERQKKCGREI